MPWPTVAGDVHQGGDPVRFLKILAAILAGLFVLMLSIGFLVSRGEPEEVPSEPPAEPAAEDEPAAVEEPAEEPVEEPAEERPKGELPTYDYTTALALPTVDELPAIWNAIIEDEMGQLGVKLPDPIPRKYYTVTEGTTKVSLTYAEETRRVIKITVDVELGRDFTEERLNPGVMTALTALYIATGIEDWDELEAFATDELMAGYSELDQYSAINQSLDRDGVRYRYVQSGVSWFQWQIEALTAEQIAALD
jgi:hypothetical protein